MLFVGILLSSVLFVFAALGDLWFDEIWSVAFAEMAETPLDLLIYFQHDNNHLLNTLFIYAIGQQNSFFYIVCSLSHPG